jgi:hypothetical protein
MYLFKPSHGLIKTNDVESNRFREVMGRGLDLRVGESNREVEVVTGCEGLGDVDVP